MVQRFTEEDVVQWLGDHTVAKARGYIAAVSGMRWRNADTLEGSVQGSRAKPYLVRVRFHDSDRVRRVEAYCACPVSYDCKHAAALVLACLRESAGVAHAPLAASRAMLPHGVRSSVITWIENFRTEQSLAAIAVSKPASTKRTHALAYLIGLNYRGRVAVTIFKARLDKEGAIRSFESSWNALENGILKPPSFVDEDDVVILRGLIKGRSTDSFDGYALSGVVGAEVLERILASERAYGASSGDIDHLDGATKLLRGEPRPARLEWGVTDDGMLRPELVCAPPASMLATSTEPGWYVDCAIGEAGPIESAIAGRPLHNIVSMPPISIDEAALLAPVLKEIVPEMPAPLGCGEARVRVIDTEPVPVLLFDSSLCYGRPWGSGMSNGVLDFAQVFFEYEAVRTPASSTAIVHQLASGDLVQLKRRDDTQSRRMAELNKAGLRKLPDSRVYGPKPFPSGIWGLPDEDAWPGFVAHAIPSLRETGWRIEMEDSFQHNVIEIDTIEGSLTADGQGWFDVEMGITVLDRRVRLEPLLADLFRRDTRWLSGGLEKIADDEPIELSTDRNERLRIAAARIKPLVRVLIDLFGGKPDDPLRISALDAGRLEAMENQGRWQFKGDNAIRELAQKLYSGAGVARIAQPAGLKAHMRPYQIEGLAWMQFLREHTLAGVLADDMGLGKTLQTLAHILTEKDHGRLDRPALAVMPTTLIHNWLEEARRFAPDLRVLDLHGPSRHERFAAIPDHDLVLTTYPLLWRDQAALAQHEYHLLILDEAQCVKNASTKAAVTVRELNARHRLCLTGTPLENHLGELWSQFDFLLPGFLGTQKDFTARWRSPIEKGGDTTRRDLLARRLRPFMLRRRKDDVATELPPKSIITRTFELEGAQRDLYETVRAAMQKKVREAISEVGLNRSHIVVLDALLKLRQVCCDPRLVKTAQAAAVKQSAKLELLMQMVPELIDEGRRILVFSQFAGMLKLIAEALHQARLPYAMITGDTTNRRAQIERFNSGEVPIFLISLKAGGVGLNLTMADTVIHYDPWWNPAVENQATDRAHRIGQDKPVFVYKLITAGSVEEKILAMQDKKAALAQAILSEDGAKAAKFSAADLEALFEPIPEIEKPKRKRA